MSPATVLAGSDAAPDWFTAALARPVERATVRCGDLDVPVRAWGQADRPGTVLVHGAAANAGWWDHIGPLLADAGDRRVVAVDLSGHGDAGTRTRYSIGAWADEVLAVAADPVAGRSAVVVGHSLGGMVALAAAAEVSLGGVVAVDSAVLERDPAVETVRARRARSRGRVFGTPEEAVAAFRPVPDQAVLGFVRDHIARTAVRRTGSSWEWKRDPRLFDRPSLYLQDLRPARCRVGLLRCGLGRLTPAAEQRMAARLGELHSAVLPDAGHHPMLDRPLELVSALDELIAAVTVRPAAAAPAARRAARAR